MSDENAVIEGFGAVEKDCIGEIMNMTMGSAATAVSNMLSAKVWITTPTVSIIKAGDLTYPELEPSIHVKIEYTQGVTGNNVLVLKQNDVQLILNQLMGMPLEVSPDFEFDEMNISAVCEVMNQMMGASATALSEMIDTPIDISTPQAIVQQGDEVMENPYGIDAEEYVCQVKFDLTIEDVINSEFISVLTIDLAKEMVNKMMGGMTAEEPAPQASSGGSDMMSQDDIAALLAGAGAGGIPDTPPPPPANPASGSAMSQDEINALLGGAGAAPAPPPAPAPQPVMQQPVMPQPQMQAAQMPQPGQMPQMGGQMGQMPAYNMGGMPYGYPPQMAYGYPPQMAGAQMPQNQRPPVNVQAVQLKSFDNYTNATLTEDQNDNLRLLMGVPLDVTVEIGSATRKVKDILEFTQGTIIELERQAGAPVDVIVNGHLIAKGDVVVIDDNFAVRITEIIKSKFLDSLGKE